MSQPLKLLGGAAALITAALVGGTLIGSVLAAPPGGTAPGSAASSTDTLFVDDETTGEVGEYCEVFKDALADELGVSVGELTPAAKAAAITTINQAVENGDLTQDVADQMIERINEADGDGCKWLGFHLRFGAHGGARVEFKAGMFEAAAAELGMETSELREALADATLEEVAEAEGVDYADVVAAAMASAKTDLDAAVEAGTITQEQADSILERLETWLNDGGPGGWGDGARPGHHFRGTSPGFFGPPPDAPAS